jgi:hypothetical protein
MLLVCRKERRRTGQTDAKKKADSEGKIESREEGVGGYE